MFREACSKIRNSIYGFLGTSQLKAHLIASSSGTAFMIAPGVLSTTAHSVHVEGDPTKPTHALFEVIRVPDIGQRMEKAKLIAEDLVRDLALLLIDNPRSITCVTLLQDIVPIGTSCGSLGFPLATVTFSQAGMRFDLIERFQGANISAFHTQADPSGRELSYYETDTLMYKGSSGCAGFTVKGNIFGMYNKSLVEQSKKDPDFHARLAISSWVPSIDIISFAIDNGVKL